MSENMCEEIPSCENFQSAICLHCNHRLCIQHIIGHERIVLKGLDNLSNTTQDIIQRIQYKSQTNRNQCDDDLLTLDKWRKEEIERVEHIYQHELQLIQHEEDGLEDFHRYLLKLTEHDARQPLERVQRQQSSNVEILNLVRQTITDVRKESKQLRWDNSTSSILDSKYSVSDCPLVVSSENKQAVSTSFPTPNNNKAAANKKVSHRSSATPIKLAKNRPRKRLIRMFANLSSIEKSQNDIDNYSKNNNKKLMLLINAYIAAWYQTSDPSARNDLLNQHILTIKKYLFNRRSDFDILVGIQSFFFNQQICENPYELMAFLLQFFLYHGCITGYRIVAWYNNNDANGCLGFENAKELIQPFIRSHLMQTSYN